MGMRQDLEDTIDLATRALRAGMDTGAFEAEDAAAAAAAGSGDLVAADLTPLPSPAVIIGPGGKPTPAALSVPVSINDNPDVTYDLTQEQIDQVTAAFPALVQELQAKVAGIKVG